MMDWFYTHVLLPVLNVLYVPCDWVLGWTERFSPIAAITIVGVISALAIILVQKYGSDQTFLGACKADLKFLKKRMKEAKRGAAYYYSDEGENITIDPKSLSPANLDILTRARALSGRIGGKYMWASLKPALWTVPLIGVIGLWTGSRLGYVPIRPGQEFTVAAHFEDQATGGFAYVIPVEGLRPATAPIAPIAPDKGGLQARWMFKAEKEGEHLLTIHGGGRSYEVTIPVAAKGGRPPELVTVVNDATPGQDQLQAIEIKLADSLPAAWWNLKMQWGGLYLIVAVGVALALRSLLKVH